jgi:hypothetical protein
MFMAKAKLVAAVVLTVAVLGGGGAITYRTRAAGPASVQTKPKPRAQDAKAADRLSALEAQLAELKKEAEDKLRAREDQLAKEKAVAADKLGALEALLAKKDKELKDTKAKLAATAEKLQFMQQLAKTFENEVKEAHKALESAAVNLRLNKTQKGPQDSDRAALLEKTRDEVELLEAQLLVKRVQLETAKDTFGAATKLREQITQLVRNGTVPHGDLARIDTELISSKGQVQLKEAELKESEVRLTQAKRRLAKLEGPKKKVTNPANQEQRLKELEQKLDALLKEMTILRQELKTRRRGNP